MKLTSIIAGMLLGGAMVSGGTGAVAGNYTLDVQFKNIPDSAVFTLGSNADLPYKQKVKTAANKLHFELDINEDYPVSLYLIGKNPEKPNEERFYCNLYAAKGVNQSIVSHRDGFVQDSITVAGAPWDADFTYYENFINSDNKARKALSDKSKEARQNNDQETAKRYLDELMEMQDLSTEKMKKFIFNHPDNPQAINMMGWRHVKFTNEEIADFDSRIPANFKSMPEYAVINRILSLKPISLGAQMTDYDLVGINAKGDSIRLTQFATPYIIVDFNSLGCGACRMAARDEIPQVLEKYGDQLSFVSYSVDEERKRMERCHELDKATWPSIWNGSGSRGDDCVKYKVTGYPTFFIFGPDRTLLETWDGWGPGIIDMKLSTVMENKKVSE